MKKFIFLIILPLLLSCESNYITLEATCDGVHLYTAFRGGGRTENKVVEFATQLSCEKVTVKRGNKILYSYGKN